MSEARRTLSIDCGGTKLKATVLDADGRMLCERVRITTPYPCPPPVLIKTLVEMAEATATSYDRVSVGFPGMIRHGFVLATPHFVTEAGPYTPVRPDLVELWHGFDVRAGLEEALGAPTRVVNDAEMAGLAVIEGRGFEVVITLGTGVGFATFDDGRLLPKVELSQAVCVGGETYDQRLGHPVRRAIGDVNWSRRVQQAIEGLQPVLWWDRLYVGGGGAKHLTVDLGPDVQIVSNYAGLLGAIHLWKDAEETTD